MRHALIIGVAVALGLAGCGGGDGSRDRVAAYIEQANDVQRDFARDFKVAGDTYRAFAQSTLAPDVAIRRLRGAAVAIVHARDALAAIDAPAEANPLHSRLLRFYDMNEDFANETLRLARYQRNSTVVLAPLDRADVRLRRELRRADAPVAQARALDRFADDVSTTIAGLRRLDVPRVLGPPHEDQITRLERTRRLARRLERALRDQDAERVAKLVKAFRRNATRTSSRRRLAKSAIEEYNRRYQQLSAAYAELRRQNAELGATLD